jgi:Vacuolar protein sorting-associated protein 62
VADLSTDTKALLERHRPLLKYDSNESYFADSAEEWTNWKDNRLLKGGTLLAAATPGDGAAQLSLAFLGPDEYADKVAAERTDLIDCKGDDYAKAAHELHQDPRYRNRMYGRAVESKGRWWLQYWFFYFFNDFNLIGHLVKAGLHEGDWEMIQLRLGEDEKPDYAVYAQHNGAEVRRWDQVDVVPGTERPLVYVARGSHASYFSPGKHQLGPVWADFADGKRRSRRSGAGCSGRATGAGRSHPTSSPCPSTPTARSGRPATRSGRTRAGWHPTWPTKRPRASRRSRRRYPR